MYSSGPYRNGIQHKYLARALYIMGPRKGLELLYINIIFLRITQIIKPVTRTNDTIIR